MLATGSEPRALAIPGAEPLTLRTHADADRIRATFGEGRRLVVVGAGWIGLEVAAAARTAGTEVTVVEAAGCRCSACSARRWAGSSPSCTASTASTCGSAAKIAEITPSAYGWDGRPPTRCCRRGRRPRTELAEAAGLDVDNGVLVDKGLRTSDPDIYAVGDIANHDHPVLGRRVRVEHWDTALNQPGDRGRGHPGRGRDVRRLPYFFSDQYDLGMEYVGHATRDDTARVVVRGDVGRREFVAFWLDDQDRILAAMNVNVWDVPDEVRPLIAARTVVDVDKLTDPGTAYADVGR